MIQSSGFLRNMLGNFGKKVITDLAISLPGLASNLASNAIKISLKRKQVEKEL